MVNDHDRRRPHVHPLIVALLPALLIGCVTNPITPDTYRRGTPPPVFGPIITGAIPGLPQALHGEWWEALAYGAVAAGGIATAIVFNSNNPILTTGVTVAGVASLASLVDSGVTTFQRYRQYTELEERLYEVDDFLNIDEIHHDSLFSALYRTYEENPVASVVLRNTSEFTLTDVVVQVDVPGLVDVPAEVRLTVTIPPAGTVEVEIPMSLSPRLQELTETSQFTGEIAVMFRALSVSGSISDPISFDVFHRNAMTWDDDRKLGTFVTPNDASVRVFSRSVANATRASQTESINPRVRTATALYAAMGEYGTVYVIDPATPFIETRESRTAVDFIQYPTDTLRSRTGDCDDLVSLYTSLLESMGIPTMLVTGPGHILMAFDTGIPADRRSEVSAQADLIVEHDGSIWVPVEVTLVGSSFLDAWLSAAAQYQVWREDEVLSTHELADAWNIYPPTSVPDTGWDPAVPSRSVLQRRMDSELAQLRGLQ